MKKSGLLLITALALCSIISANAQHSHGGQKDVELHVNPRWEECSFQLDASLTQSAWREFTKEAGLVVYYRSLTDAKPMGARNFEFSIVQWGTAFDDTKDAWNDTFVHPTETHWLKESARLDIPGLTFRAGLTDKLDIGVFWTKSPGANYGFYGSQIQYNVVNNEAKKLSASLRGSFVSMYGPEDLALTSYGADVIVSKDYVVNEKWLTLAPHVSGSAYLSASREKSEVVDLENEQFVGFQAAAGVVAKVKFVRIAMEYNAAVVNTVSFKIGAAF
jgi:hypothetical protein